MWVKIKWEFWFFKNYCLFGFDFFCLMKCWIKLDFEENRRLLVEREFCKLLYNLVMCYRKSMRLFGKIYCLCNVLCVVLIKNNIVDKY